MCKYSIKMWYGEPDTGILIARPVVEADTKIGAFLQFIVPAIRLVEADWDEFSFRVEKLDNNGRVS
jgi:hypothetical protein